MSKLFVYGIFLNEGNRAHFGMTNPRYATVADYVTVGQHIVQAVYVENTGLSLTGLLVDLPDDYNWTKLDTLEAGYDRIWITTNEGEDAYMYVEPHKDNINLSTYREELAYGNSHR